jgi:hypothetical protein
MVSVLCTATEIHDDTTRRFLRARSALGAAGLLFLVSAAGAATSARQINSDADRALNQLYAAQPKARELARRAPRC